MTAITLRNRSDFHGLDDCDDLQRLSQQVRKKLATASNYGLTIYGRFRRIEDISATIDGND